jgi:hypothetical protein
MGAKAPGLRDAGLLVVFLSQESVNQVHYLTF